MKIGILSDVHGNRSALSAVLDDLASNNITYLMLLGDIIDYGPHSNEVIEMLCGFRGHILCNIQGNHENAILTDKYERFSSDRGRKCAQTTKLNLNSSSWDYIKNQMKDSGKADLLIDGKRILAIHGSLKDTYWKAITPEESHESYREYDYVFSGHSHHPHFFEIFFPVNDPLHRNKKKTVFVNPGSVGQPRNLDPHAQYAVWNSSDDSINMRKVKYNIAQEMKCFSEDVDEFYKNRLEVGI